MFAAAASRTLFPCENCVSFLKGIVSTYHSFQGGRRLILFQIGLFSWLEETQVPLQGNFYFRSCSIKHIVSLWKLCRFLKGILPATKVIQEADRLFLLQVDLFSWVEEIHVSLEIKPSMLEAEATSTLIPYENWFKLGKEYCLQITIFRVEKGNFCSKQAYTTAMMPQKYLSKENHLY
jgi:hypothetical protein